jgi:alkylation response protein AidB-like acyl-CoA dehydrogenase
MNFDFSEEQVMLRDSVARFVQDRYNFDSRQEIASSEEGMSRENWQSFAELGWLSVPFAEEFGGFGGSAVDTMVVMEQLGKGLVVEPYLATIMLFGGLLQETGSTSQQDEWLGRVIAGEVQGAFAWLERQSRFEIADVETNAAADGEGFVLSGEKTVVFNGAVADALVVSARTSGAQRDEEGISLFLIDPSSEGVERTAYRLMDGQLVANITFNKVRLEASALLGESGKALPAIQKVVNQATVALCAEALGIMEKLNASTVEYTRTREQFGVSIASFQALQHRMVDTMIAYEQAKSMLYRTVCDMENDGEEAERNVHALKVMTAKSGRLIGDEAIQLHGGMGLTDELDIGHYVKRLMMINTIFGSGDYHQSKFNELSYN